MLTGQRLCHSKAHQDSVLSALNQQRKDGLLCDVTLVAGEQKFHAHKAVLAACSDYFRVSAGWQGHNPILFNPHGTASKRVGNVLVNKKTERQKGGWGLGDWCSRKSHVDREPDGRTFPGIGHHCINAM